jgi:hypothetical protein
VLNPADLKVLAAYVAVMAWPSCKAWLAVAQAMAMTGLSDRQFEKSRVRLLGKNPAGRAYLVAARQSRSVSTYVLINPWRDEARAHVEAMHAYHKEVARLKKARQRAALSPKNVQGQIPPRPRTEFGPVPEKNSDNTPLVITPREEGAVKDNPRGSNVVPFNNPRKASA